MPLLTQKGNSDRADSFEKKWWSFTIYELVLKKQTPLTLIYITLFQPILESREECGDPISGKCLPFNYYGCCHDGGCLALVWFLFIYFCGPQYSKCKIQLHWAHLNGWGKGSRQGCTFLYTGYSEKWNKNLRNARTDNWSKHNIACPMQEFLAKWLLMLCSIIKIYT